MLPAMLRQRRNAPAEITTSPAPVLAPPADAPPTPPAPPVTVDSMARGVCWHDAHVELAAGRHGVTPLRERTHLAALTPCLYVNRDGR